MKQANTIKQETRTVEYSKVEFDENVFDDFDSHEIIENADGINIKEEKSFDSKMFEEFDLVGLDETNEKFMVIYEVNYVASEDTVFLTATLNENDNIPIIDTIPGLVSMNGKGEADIFFQRTGI